MKCLALAAAGAAVAGLAACTSNATPSSTVTSSSDVASSPVATHSAIPVAECRQQYDIWKQGPGNGLVAELSAISSADTAGDMRVLTGALTRAQPALAKAARYPMPGCVDPKGYWTVLLMHINAAAASRHSAASLRAAMAGVPKVTSELIAELNHTDG